MSRQVTVRVPISRAGESTPASSPHHVTASFSLDATRPRIVERGGAWARSTIPVDEDPTLVAFREACTRAGRSAPADVRIRVVVPAALGDAGDSAVSRAASIAGAAGARALLDLAIDDDTLVDIAGGIDGAVRSRAADALARHTVIIQPTCDA